MPPLILTYHSSISEKIAQKDSAVSRKTLEVSRPFAILFDLTADAVLKTVWNCEPAEVLSNVNYSTML